MLLRDRLIARLSTWGATGTAPDYTVLAREVLGISNAPPELARRLVSQALVVEDRLEEWRRVGARICLEAPHAPGVYVLRDSEGAALYVGKANDLRRRLSAHFSGRRWKNLKASFVRAVTAEWIEVGSELEALLREATLIEELRPSANIQIGPPRGRRAIPRAIARDVVVLLPSIDRDSVELLGARADDGSWTIQRTRRNGADLVVHATRLMRFFHSPLRRGFETRPFAPIVFSWLARRGEWATRVDPHDAAGPKSLRRLLATALADRQLFAERIVVR